MAAQDEMIDFSELVEFGSSLHSFYEEIIWLPRCGFVACAEYERYAVIRKFIVVGIDVRFRAVYNPYV